MKKIFLAVISFGVLFAYFPVQINAEEKISDYSDIEFPQFNNSFDPDADIKLYGEIIDEEIVVYDEELGIDFLEEYALQANLKNRLSRGWENSGNVGRNELNALRNLHSSITWIRREGVWSLSLATRKDFGGHYKRTGYTREQTWRVVEILFYNDYQWRRNATGMYNQYVCHWNGMSTFPSKFKSPWNVEPSNTKSYSALVLNNCN